MPKDFPRSRRIAEQLQRELADLIRLELKDPRIASLVTITGVEVSHDQSHAKVFFTLLGEEDFRMRLGVEVSHDQSHAKVFFTLLGDDRKIEETRKGLTSAAGFLRTQLGHRMKLRTIPQLDFKYDASVERGVRLSHLIDEAVASDPKPPSEG